MRVVERFDLLLRTTLRVKKIRKQEKRVFITAPENWKVSSVNESMMQLTYNTMFHQPIHMYTIRALLHAIVPYV